VSRRELVQVTDCDGCGRCCETIGFPPFEAANPDFGAQLVITRGMTANQIDDAAFDTETFLAMPAKLRAEHAAMLLEAIADPTGLPCVWYEPRSKSCRHYDWRPATCRRFETNGDKCSELRREPEALLVWDDDTSIAHWRNPRGQQVGAS